MIKEIAEDRIISHGYTYTRLTPLFFFSEMAKRTKTPAWRHQIHIS
jgi:hypothetical protein